LASLALALALRGTPASAASFAASLPAPTCASLAFALGVAPSPGGAPRAARAALLGAAAWCRRHRALRAEHAGACLKQWAAASRRAFGGGGAAPPAPLGAAAVSAVLHFMSPTAGTAVMLSPSLALTCAHCVSAEGDDEEEEDDDDDEEEEEEEEEAGEEGGGAPAPARVGRLKLLIAFTGAVLAARCVAVDERRDVALLRVEAAGGGPLPALFPRVLPLGAPSPWGARVLCTGNPSEFDGESAARKRIRFLPPVFHTSAGRLLGATERRKRGLGGARHSCWTYWGHSGAPLLTAEGVIAGLHSSWDDSAGSRHAVRGEVVAEFVAAFVAGGGVL